MNIHLVENPDEGNHAAADWLATRLVRPEAGNVMVAGGNTPLALYREIARRQLPLAHLTIFALDEYVGVPPADPRTCANLIRRSVIEPWGIPARQFHHLSSLETEAKAGIEAYERRIRTMGGLDLLILGLGRNGHVGFNEPGSTPDSVGRVLDLDPISVEANRTWFGGDYAPSRGVTVGVSTILSARQILLLAFGPEKTDAVTDMVDGVPREECPASWLQNHPQADLFLDPIAAARLSSEKERAARASRASTAS